MLNTDNLTPMQLGRLNTQLDKRYRYDDGVRTLRKHLEKLKAGGPLTKAVSDGMIDYNRRRFNAMSDGREQAAYMARLSARRHYWINGHKVPKVVYDAVDAPVTEEF